MDQVTAAVKSTKSISKKAAFSLDWRSCDKLCYRIIIIIIVICYSGIYLLYPLISEEWSMEILFMRKSFPLFSVVDTPPQFSSSRRCLLSGLIKLQQPMLKSFFTLNPSVSLRKMCPSAVTRKLHSPGKKSSIVATSDCLKLAESRWYAARQLMKRAY